ncbi:MAG: EAL domain-containing protein, partial [Magnetococcales bacterium]|nr:EAL domain-containing protein [Magnetococcales bacterium]
LMFGEWWSGWIGMPSPVEWRADDPFFSAFFLFQALFCSTAVTIVSGMVAERIRFGSYVLLSLALAALIYPLFGHWVWNGIDGGSGQGWLAAAGFVDWAGSTVVHSLGGWFGLALLLVIGPRLDRFGPNGEVNEITGSNLPLTALGVLILWFGWIGFNGGSTLELNATIVPVIVNTCIAAAAGGVFALLFDWRLSGGVFHVMPPLNGILAGLVSITAGAHAMSPSQAIVIGGLGGVFAFGADRLMLRLKIDDAVGAFPVHTVGGIWGTLSVALFGDPQLLGTGLSFLPQLWVQFQGVVACWVVGFLVPWLVLRTMVPGSALRVTADEEKMGLNVAEHGAKSELHDFFQILTRQVATGDLSLRAPENPFTEIGQIGCRYNQVMNALEATTSKINAIVSHSADAIITVDPSSHALLSANPAAEKMFGLPWKSGNDPTLETILILENDQEIPRHEKRFEAVGVGNEKKKFPLEGMLVEAVSPEGELLIGTFRDITERKEAEQSLIESEERFRTVYENAAMGMALVNDKLEIVDANATLLKMLKISWDEAFSSNLCGITHPDDIDLIASPLEAILTDQQKRHIAEVRCVCSPNYMIWARLAFSKFHLEQSAGPLAIVIVEDITDQKRAEKKIRLAASVFENTTEPIVIFNSEGLIEEVNSAFDKVFGFDSKSLKGLEMRHLLSARYDSEFMKHLEEQLLASEHWQGELMGRCSDQTLIPMWVSLSLVRDREERLQNRIAVLTDLSEQKEREETIWRHANFDPLTKLPNRRLFQDRLDQAVGQANRTGVRIGLFFIDLDRFKLVNDTLGHQAGDELLKVVAERLNEAVRSTDTVARLGGDEFTVILQNFHKNSELGAIARTIIQEMEKPITLDDNTVSVSASIGIASYPDDADSTQDLIRCADSALYQAKDSGRNTYQFFTEALNQALIDQVALENTLRQAIIDEELFMVYQPQMDLRTGGVPSAEALVRWGKPDGTTVSPGTFIPMAEETGLILPLGTYVIKAVCRDIRAWIDQGLDVPRIAINASAKQFHFEEGLPHQIETICREEGVPLSAISVEITENSLMSNQQQSVEVLDELAAMNIAIALDDFGTGYSSLSRLKKLPIGVVKLDRSFITGIPEDRENSALVQAIIQMAQALDLEVVAEGIETPDQLEFLRALACEKIQGFLLSKPLTADLFMQFCLDYVGTDSEGAVRSLKRRASG